MAWLTRVEFGAVALVFCVVLARQLLREARPLARACMTEDWVLLAGAVVTAGRLALAPAVGQMETGWVWFFAMVCAAHLAAKGFRATRVES